ncbi:signal peptide containing protein [Theileria equi strain WA]|uniref:Signal peptide containing protein n=1 Tax=Theileria equi strain WA TaxID=1537102 RepID=L1LDF4_THEEQ|nr:signal peptide containing protein [Theileria equi strain WA]EKX73482.1 signal peptide containing protein [Theileria equi strain WA]|eukprot:XP_004832934.1 signal peptide containing protein [Theileria equi strain WA]
MLSHITPSVLWVLFFWRPKHPLRHTFSHLPAMCAISHLLLPFLLYTHLVCEAQEDDDEKSDSSGSPLVVDVNSTPSGTCYKRFETGVADAEALVLFPGLETIAAITNGDKTIWKPGNNQTCKMCIVFLNKDKNPGVVYLMIENSSGLTDNPSSTFRDLYLKFKGGIWKPSARKYPNRITDLMLNSPIRSTFTVDIERESHGTKCKNFKVLFDDIPTDIFIPKPGHICTKVVVGEETLWENPKEKCILVMAHLKNRQPTMVHMFIWDEVYAFKHHYMELESEGWVPINQKDYESQVKALEDIKTMPPEVLIQSATLVSLTRALIAAMIISVM